MKTLPRLTAFGVACLSLVLCFYVAQAQNQSKPKPKPKKPTTWAEKKAKTLKPLTAEEEQLIEQALPEKSVIKPKEKRKILVFYRCEGFVHASIVAGNRALERILLRRATDPPRPEGSSSARTVRPAGIPVRPDGSTRYRRTNPATTIPRRDRAVQHPGSSGCWSWHTP